MPVDVSPRSGRGEGTMRIGTPTLQESGAEVVYSVEVHGGPGPDVLWFSVDARFRDLVSDRADAALVALLVPAMAAGVDLIVDGRVSERLFFQLGGPLQKLLQLVVPSLSRVRIEASRLDQAPPSATGVATGFSGGVDSFCVLADHYFGSVSPGYRVTHLLFNNVGSHGAGGEQTFDLRFRRLAPIAERMGLPLVRVNSNLDSYFELGFEQTHTCRNAAVAHLLQGGIGRFMYASAVPYQETFVGPSRSTAYSDPISLPMLSSEVVDLFSSGAELSRVEKTLRVAELEDSYDSLDVCVSGRFVMETGGTNCSKCRKCMRTLLTLEIAGALERYSEAFDMQVYREHREQFVETLLRSKDSLSREVVDFAREKGFPFGFVPRLRAAVPAFVGRLAGIPRSSLSRMQRRRSG